MLFRTWNTTENSWKTFCNLGGGWGGGYFCPKLILIRLVVSIYNLTSPQKKKKKKKKKMLQ